MCEHCETPVSFLSLVSVRNQVNYRFLCLIIYYLELCPSPNAELLHAQVVFQLHRTSYFCEKPFELTPQITKNVNYHDTPLRNNVPSTQSTRTKCTPPVSSSPVNQSLVKGDTAVVPTVCIQAKLLPN